MSVHVRFGSVALVAAMTLLAACSGESDDAASPPSTTTTVDARTVSACTALVATDSNAADPDSPEYPAVAKKIADGLATVVANTDGAVASAAGAAQTAMARVAADPAGPDPLEDPTVAQAVVTVNKWGYDTCGYLHIDVTATDMTTGGTTMRMYSGVPATLKAGKYALALNNTSDEVHIVVIARKKPGVTDDTAALLRKPDSELFSALDIVAGDAGASPKSTGYLVADLTPGNYIFFCPIPDSTGRPHYESGMHTDVTVS